MRITAIVLALMALGVAGYHSLRVDPPDVLGRECMSRWATMEGNPEMSYGWYRDCREAEGDHVDSLGRRMVLVSRRVLTRSEAWYSSDLFPGPLREAMK